MAAPVLDGRLAELVTSLAASQGVTPEAFARSAIELQVAVLSDRAAPEGPAVMRATENFATCERLFAHVVVELKSDTPDMERMLVALSLLEKYFPAAVCDLRQVMAGAGECVGSA